MRRFGDHDPVTVAVYYVIVLIIAMFTMNPVLHLIALIGGLLTDSKSERVERYLLAAVTEHVEQDFQLSGTRELHMLVHDAGGYGKDRIPRPHADRICNFLLFTQIIHTLFPYF